MKKLLSLLMCVILICSSSCITVFSAEDNNITTGRSRAIRVFHTLGVLKFDDNGEINDEGVMTRASFAEYVACLLKAEPIDSAKFYFTDVSSEHWANRSINALVDLKLISSAQNKKFRPDEAITYAEACKILLAASGYDIYADARGGFPLGYLLTASELKLFSKFKNENMLTIGESLELIFDAFSTGVYNISEYKANGEVTFNVDKTKTLLSIYWNVFVGRGTVNATYGVRLDGKYHVDDGQAIIDDIKYTLIENLDMEGFVGSNIEYLYEDEKDEPDEGKIIYAQRASGKNEDVIICSDFINTFDSSSYVLSYFEDKDDLKTKDIHIEKNISIIYNGIPTLTSMADIIDEFITGSKRGKIRLVPDKSNGLYNLAVVESTELFVLDYINSDFTKLYNKFNSLEILEQDNYKIVRVINNNGDKVPLSNLKTPCVLNLAKSKDETMLKIIVSSEIITAKVTEKEGATDNNIFLDGICYKTDPVFRVKYGSSVLVGSTYKFYTDCFGYISYAECVASSAQTDDYIGYLISCGIDSWFVQLKVFNSLGEMKIYNLANKVDVDGVLYSGNSGPISAVAAIPGTKGIFDLDNPKNDVNKPVLEKQVIRYSLNSNGQIRKIDTARVTEYEEASSTLTKRESVIKKQFAYHISASQYYRFDRGIIYAKPKTLVFCIPYEDNNGYLMVDDYRVRTIGNTYVTDESGNNIKVTDNLYSVNDCSFQGGMYYMVEEYNYNSSNPYADIILYKKPVYAIYNSPIMVDKVTKAIDNDGKTICKLYGLSDGAEIVYDVENPNFVSDLVPGDLVYGYLSTDKKLTGIKRVFSRSTLEITNKPGNYSDTPSYWYDGYYRPSTNTEYHNVNWQLTTGYITKKDGSVMAWSYEPPANQNFDEIYDFATIPIMIFDSEKKQNCVYKGTVADAVDFASGGQGCSRIVLFSRSGTVRAGFIYK